MHTNVYLMMFICMHTHMYACMYVCVCTYVHLYVSTYVCTVCMQDSTCHLLFDKFLHDKVQF